MTVNEYLSAMRGILPRHLAPGGYYSDKPAPDGKSARPWPFDLDGNPDDRPAVMRLADDLGEALANYPPEETRKAYNYLYDLIILPTIGTTWFPTVDNSPWLKRIMEAEGAERERRAALVPEEERPA